MKGVGGFQDARGISRLWGKSACIPLIRKATSSSLELRLFFFEKEKKKVLCLIRERPFAFKKEGVKEKLLQMLRTGGIKTGGWSHQRLQKPVMAIGN